MLTKATFNTKTHEIQIENLGKQGWQLTVYKLKHGALRETEEKQILEHYSTAYLYVEEKYLKRGMVV